MEEINRIIKFRAWDSKLKKFPFKDFHIVGECTAFDLLNQYSIENYNDLVISQYIGISDRGGRELYEGDIVRFDYHRYENEMESDLGEIFFQDGIFYFHRKLMFATNDLNFKKKNIEYVGNIFENPNLLK